MEKFVRFGKSADSLLEHKQAFFLENDARLAEARRWASLYAAQPKRTACINCAAPLEAPTFIKFGVPYHVCGQCGHLNGGHEITETYTTALYTEDKGASYGRNYTSSTRNVYNKRRDDIYVPKAEFLSQALRHCGQDPAGLSFADFGAGSGYFVAAMKELGLSSVQGFEVSGSQVHLGNTILGEEALVLHKPEELVSLVSETGAQVASFIGVLEHLPDPRTVLAALSRNANIEYLYISVPMFSLSVYIELIFQQIMPRHLSGGHTHLYTESSMDWFIREFGFSRIAEWWFGTDLVDLYRSMFVTLNGDKETEGVAGLFDAAMKPAIDAMQLGVDERRLSSEVHMLLRKE